ncbi:MAG: hypothetical protein QW186_07925 [Candidatus Bathyarchaeia archaeon]
MIEKRGNTLIVGAHEWAWSIRTSGFPVYAVLEIGGKHEAAQIGTTRKQMTRYELPRGTVAVFREYVSNRGYRGYHVYIFQNNEIKQYILHELDDFSIPQTESQENKKILEFIRNWILNYKI